ncbi:8-amino-7-oxononanoate synthase [Vibrio sp. V27_P1S3P104]|uniref:8-amino-7-oxononanoate synthase n=1 Tax=unclassified Vibrio TaxID=2614977 RepID=UPI0013735733|nr:MULTISPECIES: 8-amino-7-oxononanoate synthase [unclassified Vibrio]NAW68874.1 8-amino-7-oxononanoate synthase [Vibrio sp. V28_P6S34P95]NAX04073.1 8-amino-7-oxononanoate synthase [Vibrio sp. V30_P3S12P165]NAX33986.1 8-amino-7-oxononanoate synthase [Vibrio sp. V29_P1S30P107]NAX36261.1 8-amino-7-oxononanoate synthase [Vibrio sp. V27_P1S3P104]NAX41480.1 8-amino-7-oxononanoate synthase [Vibrio sp. V26_P1S5P106]
MTARFNARIQQALLARKQQDGIRQLQPLLGGNQPYLERNGQGYFNFSSNDYLGLATDKSLIQAWQHGLSLYGAGSGASPLVTGFSAAHERLEKTLCDWFGYPRAILFASGFSANQALLFTLLEKGDLLLQDKLNHASLMEAGRLSLATMKRFKHNDVQHLTQLLTESATCLVVTEGVFSMDGDCAPLAEIHQQVNQHAWLMVDDAHGVGVLGQQGRGSCEQAGIWPDILVVTFGKALGVAGAAILCRDELGDYVTQFARHHVYSTAMPPAQAHAITHAIGMVQQQTWRRDKLAELAAVYDQALSPVAGFIASQTPIKPFLLGSSQRAMTIAHHLRERGIWLTAIRPPTVPHGAARLRITLTTNHSIEQVKMMTQALMDTLEKYEWSR